MTNKKKITKIFLKILEGIFLEFLGKKISFGRFFKFDINFYKSQKTNLISQNVAIPKKFNYLEKNFINEKFPIGIFV